MFETKQLPAEDYAVETFEIYRSLPLGAEQVPILNGLSFKIQQGEWIALTGPSGSGKSTLLGIMAGLDTPSRGQIKINGVDITNMKERELARLRNAQIGIVFQSFNLIPTLTAQENVEAPLYVSKYAREASKRAAEMLQLVGLGNRRHHRPNQLSGGQQQRVAIARALVTRPALLVADEPTGNLDSRTGGQMLDLITQLHRELAITVIMATHDPAIAAIANRELHLIDGQLAIPLLRKEIAQEAKAGELQ